MSSRGASSWFLSVSVPVLLAFAALPAAGAEARTDHKQYKDAPIADCRECHRGSGVADNHGATFLKEHRVLAQKATTNCFECHQQSQCLDCHNGGTLESAQKSLSRRGESMPRSHAADFISSHAVVARDDPRSCQRCHESPRFCSDCHTKQIGKNRSGMAIRPHSPTFVGPGQPDPAWISFHRAEARRNLQTCQSCHPQKSDCSNFACHPGLGGR